MFSFELVFDVGLVLEVHRVTGVLVPEAGYFLPDGQPDVTVAR
ncbi:hypothetical protein [Streptomyces sp. NPDC088400]